MATLREIMLAPQTRHDAECRGRPEPEGEAGESAFIDTEVHDPAVPTKWFSTGVYES